MTLTFITPDDLLGVKQIIPGDDFVQPEEGFFVEKLPPGPPSTWLIDWEAQTVTSDWQPPPTPDWVGFNAAILTNPEWLATAAAVRDSSPDLIVALYVALSQVRGGQFESFRQLFLTVMTLAEVPPAQREAWASMAEGEFSLPPEFVAIVRGS